MALSIEKKIANIDAQIEEWEDSAYNAEIAHAVHTRIKSDAARLAGFVEVMQKAEGAIRELRGMRAALESAEGQ